MKIKKVLLTTMVAVMATTPIFAAENGAQVNTAREIEEVDRTPSLYASGTYKVYAKAGVAGKYTLTVED